MQPNRRPHGRRTRGTTALKCLVPVAQPKPALIAITQDKSGSQLRRDTREILNQRGRQVARLGFGQSSKRVTLFVAQTGPWKTYVDFDSTDVIRIR